jgi:hypothetical protein
MTLQNRVTPWGEIVATPERGAWMGNRGGCFHDPQQRLTHRRWATKQWITCRLEFKGWHREVMQPGLYTELFFMDEVTALAAGHRPCFECRHQDAVRFRDAFTDGSPHPGLTSTPRAAEIDAILHADRLAGREKRTFVAPLALLPTGTMVCDPSVSGACLVFDGALLPWSFAGYGPAREASGSLEVAVLTPLSTVAAIRAGYHPEIHRSAAERATANP